MISSRSPPFRNDIGVRSGPRTRWNGVNKEIKRGSMLELKIMNDPTITIEEATTLPELIAA